MQEDILEAMESLWPDETLDLLVETFKQYVQRTYNQDVRQTCTQEEELDFND